MVSLALFATLCLTAGIEERVDDLLSKMTQEEKITMLGGVDGFYTNGVERLGIPRFKMSDGPVGARNYGPAVAFPAGVCLAATWNPRLALQTGVGLGKESRDRGVHFLLGPGINIARVPQNGRNFEYFGEDPWLAGVMSVEYIKGLQSQGVAATVKHYVANNQEINRGSVDVIVDERTLHELYLAAFEDSIVKGGSWAIMSSYNKINGPHSTESDYLNNKVLKGYWGFKGLVMSDWGATHSTKGALLGGLDLEMPGPANFKPARVAELVKSGEVPQAVIDDKVRRILRTGVALGFLDRPQQRKETPAELAQTRAAALDVAREGVVLLKNRNGLLPLNPTKLKKVVVLGPNADPAVTGGGGSSYTTPERKTSVVDGLRALLGEAKVTSLPGAGVHGGALQKSLPIENLKAEFYAGKSLAGPVRATVQLKEIKWNTGTESPFAGVPADHFFAKITGKLKPTTSGEYVFAATSDDGVRIKVDGKTLIDSWQEHGPETFVAQVRLQGGRELPFEVEYFEAAGDTILHVGWAKVPDDLLGEYADEIASADAVVVCAGFTPKLESEGFDRTYELPYGQAQLIGAANKLNKNVIVVLNAGASVATADWLPQTPGLLQAWYPGQEGGKAVAEILLGKVNPSGKLPTSWEAKLADLPAMSNYPGENGQVRYEEKLDVGYRFFDKGLKKPLFPFGFGLSYTTFGYRDLKIAPRGQEVSVTFTVRNTGKKAGKEVAQVYVSAPRNSPVPMPPKQLKGFAKVDLKPGQEKRVEVTLDRKSFMYWDVKTHAWKLLPGLHGIKVGSSTADIRLTGTASVK